jgi:hypothetical protein
MTTTQTTETVPGLESMTVYEIADVIRKDWKKVYFGAVSYLDAMGTMMNVTSSYGADDGKGIILYFLSNASTWKGPVAKAVKAELKKRIK